MKKTRSRFFRGLTATTLTIPALLGGSLWLAHPALGQEQGKATEVKQPAAPSELPPLNLPDIPKDKELDNAEPKVDIPAPPPPRPLPEGPAVVKAGLKPSGIRYFKLFYDGQPVGWSKFRITGEMKLGETDAVILSSEGDLKVGFDKIDSSHFVSRLMVDRSTLRPAFYKCIQTTGKSSFEVECVYSKSMVAQTNITGDNRFVHFHNFEGETPQLMFNNLWGHIDTFPEHYWLMARSAVNGGQVKAYDPILRGEGEVIVYAPKDSTYDFEGRKVKSKTYDISDLNGTMLATVVVAADSFELLEVTEIGSGLKMAKSDAGIEQRMANVKGVDLSGSRIVDSNVVFPDPEQLTALEANVEIDLRGGQLVEHRIAGYRQYFTGELTEGHMKGRVFVRSVPREIPFDTTYPLDDKVPDEFKDKLLPGPGVEMDYPPLATKAREIAWKSRTTFEAAKRLNGYVYDLEEGVSLPSARYALETGVGNAESKALLLVAMARAVKLPARKISGISFRDGSWVPHHWVEIWLGKDIGWTPFDPTTGEAGRVGAAHIALLDSGDVQNISIKVTDYSPRATKRVPYIARELQWGVGEQRTYGVYRDGVKIGTEVAKVGDIEVVDGQEVYKFNAKSDVQTPSGREVTSADQLLTPQGLPRRIVLQHKTPLESDAVTYDFNEDTVVIKHGKEGDEGFDKSLGRQYPFAKGTYFTDPRLLSHWALLAGQVPLDADSEKEFTIHTYVPGSKTQKQFQLEKGEKEEISLTPSFSADKRTKDEKMEAPKEGEKPEGADGDKVEKPADGDKPAENAEKPADGNKPPENAEGDKPAGEGNSITADPLENLPKVDSTLRQATHLFTDSGMDFWVNDQGQVIKIEIPDQGIELILEKVETKLE